jgi:hypothetical protein
MCTMRTLLSGFFCVMQAGVRACCPEVDRDCSQATQGKQVESQERKAGVGGPIFDNQVFPNIESLVWGGRGIRRTLSNIVTVIITVKNSVSNTL